MLSASVRVNRRAAINAAPGDWAPSRPSTLLIDRSGFGRGHPWLKMACVHGQKMTRSDFQRKIYLQIGYSLIKYIIVNG